MNEYLIETPSIDFMNFHIQEKAQELKYQSDDNLDYIKRSYIFVRDGIPHSWDIKTEVVSRTASDVLKNKTGICWTKSCLLAALLRANGIPSGISYQLLTRADDDSEGYMIHALNTVYIKDLIKWIIIDARGIKENINAYFSLDDMYIDTKNMIFEYMDGDHSWYIEKESDNKVYIYMNQLKMVEHRL